MHAHVIYIRVVRSAVKYIEEMLKDATLRGGGRAGGPGGRPARGIPSDFNLTAIIGSTYRQVSLCITRV